MDIINAMPEAQAAYDQCMVTLIAAHAKLNAIAAATPVDWDAYEAALGLCNSAQDAAQAALTVFESAVLDVPAVAALRQKLVDETAVMKARTDSLAATAAALNSVTSVSDDLAGLATSITKFV